MGFLTSLVGSFVEAWSEVRVNKLRVLLSLIGVALAVAALTGVAAAGAIVQQGLTESFERSGGRPALLTIGAPYNPNTGEQSTDTAQLETDVASSMDRYGIEYWSRVLYGQLEFRAPEGVRSGSTQVVDASYGTMHRIKISEGGWFRNSDADRLAPAIVVDDNVWKAYGSPDLRTHPTVDVRAFGGAYSSAIIIGVVPSTYAESFDSFILVDSYDQISASAPEADPSGYVPTYQYEAWVPPENADSITQRLSSDLALSAGEGFQVDVFRSDFAGQGYDPLEGLKLGVGGVAGLVLLLGALSLVNISLVTVRTRIREIGIRRSFGATAGRVFFGVMMESVVATVFAGAIGVGVAILALKNPWVATLIAQQGIEDVPAFPVSAALLGLAAATAVGALAGLVPALVAVRVKPIDAIRY